MTIPEPVQRGAECAWCRRPFVEAHGSPAVCDACFDRALATRQSFGLLPRARFPLREAAAE